ncbi:MAG: ABC transporter ATP-binding protein [Lachnospiraceae bacterium]|nr:ABC transporter ATP-binding protein [Lachnospiraceae bacterium]
MLELVNVCKSYKEKEVLHNFSMKFEKGIYGLLGPNGAGKSTMMNIIADVLKPSKGDVLYDGVSIYKLKEKYRSHIGYLPQHVGYYDNFTADMTLEYFANLRGVPKKEYKERIENVLKAVNLSENAKQKVKTFSGGMKQRLGIAVALIANPDVLILDEPTVGLDPKERINFRELLRGLASEKTIILSTHIVSDVEDIADYLIFLKNGNIVLSDSTDNILEKTSVEEQYMKFFGEDIV